MNFSPLFYQGLGGIVFFVLITWLISENRRAVNFRFTLSAIALQFILAALILHVPHIHKGLLFVASGIEHIKCATCEGTKFVFGYLGGGDSPFVTKEGARPFIFAFQPLPMVIVVSALSMLLFHWNILPAIVRGISFAFRKTLGIGGALGVCAAAKIFLGQTDAPLLIRPYLPKFTRSELFSVMVAGMATTSSVIMAVYSEILQGTLANPLTHILTASIISVPGALCLSRILVPHTGPDTDGSLVMPYKFEGSMDAISTGATDGMKLFLSLIAMLITALALVYVTNVILGLLPDVTGIPLSLQRILGWVMAPITWLMGVPWHEATTAGHLLGTKTALNEMVAFIELSGLPKGQLSAHTNLIMLYALCGFANFSSIGIQIGGIGTMVPERRVEIIQLGFKALFAGTLASCLSGTIVGMLTELMTAL